MSDGKLNEQERYNNLKNEVGVIENCHNFLYTGRFPGGAAQSLAVCQIYMKQLYNHMKAECDKLAPLELPKAVESKAEAISNDSSKPEATSAA